MSDDWKILTDTNPRLLRGGNEIEVGQPHSWTRPLTDELTGELPVFTGLLASAEVTDVTVDGQSHELLGWGPEQSQSRRLWLCPSPPTDVPERLPAVQAALFGVFGGIGITANGPEEGAGGEDARLLNSTGALTAALARSPIFRDSVDDYRWIWEDDGLDVPIDPDDYVTIDREANGNLTVAHRETGAVLLFLPDHARGDVEVLDGCPEMSLYTAAETPDLTTWIETLAAEWSGDAEA
ncbi:hypothetical protein [Nocardioides sp. GXZ039]|uniref:hypothetical protein n=1 Tax=Nocardioides sp. GXZ039 TaxID=3136018 RepID=UPI0030F479C6